MTILEKDAVVAKGLPLYDMRTLFDFGGGRAVNMSVITILPGSRVPIQGRGSHQADEYSYFLEGEVYTESGSDCAVVGAQMATLIPRGEEHWCENRSDKPCTLVCVMVE